MEPSNAAQPLSDLPEAVQALRPKLVRYAERQLGPVHAQDAHDVVHDAFVKLISRFRAGSAPSNCEAYLKTTIKCLIVDAARRRALRPAIVDTEHLRGVPARPDRDVVASLALAEGLRELQGISPKVAALIRTLLERGGDRASAAKELGLRPNNFRAMLHRMRPQLDRALGGGHWTDSAPSSVVMERMHDLMPGDSPILFHPGDDHPQVMGVHPDNAPTGRLFGIIRQSMHDVMMPGRAARHQGHIICIGSGVSNPLTRDIFGDERVPGHPSLNRLGLPVTYAYYGDTQRYMRYVGGRPQHGKVAGLILPGSREPVYVRVDKNGLLANDYLVITVMPNFLDPVALRRGDRLVIVGGVHGIGTQAFSNLFTSPNLWKRIGVFVRTHGCFQIVVEVVGVAHSKENGRLRSVPMQLKLAKNGLYELDAGAIMDKLPRLRSAAPERESEGST